MKNVLILLLIVSPFFAVSQKMKYRKDVYPLIKERKPEAFEKLKEYVQEDPKHSNATYWLAKYYDAFAIEYVSSASAKLAIETYNTCLTNTSSLNLTVLHAQRYPDAKGVESEELYKSLKEFIHSRIKELDNLMKASANAPTKKNAKASSIKELSEKLKIYFPEEVKNLAITEIQVEYSERTYKGKTALNGPIEIKGLDKITDSIISVNGNIDCGWMLNSYQLDKKANNEFEFEGIILDEEMGEWGTNVSINVTDGIMKGQQLFLVFHDGNYWEEGENYFNNINCSCEYNIGDDKNIGRKVKGVFIESNCLEGGEESLFPTGFDEETGEEIYEEPGESYVTSCYRPIQLNYK